ncbi:nucleotidyltransferase domain-containing protein [Actinomycetospora endophytica]|uniref:Nucleotidyltransferase domain-containing protein n=1 Tax=Actinomycetospora endophytica TaxID=2291215 RepID=A0ABS8PGB5_9PSEU|nr:nucleotidyltransferase domain-containing protein [Actinomycetospora endophytica]MCD2197053.1 nucleotidyltransferase domain-containing protein [Actinomycetospora endophytica]
MRTEEILDAWFPEAVGGLVAGSVARGEDTPTSDLDLLVLLPGRPAPMRRTERIDGRVVEFFVHTEASFLGFVDREVPLRRSPLLHMGAHGLVIRDREGCMTRLRDLARARWSAGPPSLSDAELEDRRYRLTALLDDLADERDPVCLASLAAAAFPDVADLALASRRRWGGRGRWLARRLAEADASLADSLVTGLREALDGDAVALVGCGRAELDRVGGRLEEGYARFA